MKGRSGKKYPQAHGGDFLDKTARTVIRVGGLRGREGGREIEDNLIQIDGVKNVRVSLPESTVEIQFDPGVIRQEYLERTLNSLGYSPYVRPGD